MNRLLHIRLIIDSLNKRGPIFPLLKRNIRDCRGRAKSWFNNPLTPFDGAIAVSPQRARFLSQKRILSAFEREMTPYL